jgi:hypothetical protein
MSRTKRKHPQGSFIQGKNRIRGKLDTGKAVSAGVHLFPWSNLLSSRGGLPEVNISSRVRVNRMNALLSFS